MSVYRTIGPLVFSAIFFSMLIQEVKPQTLCHPGASCSKLRMPLVNNWLKIQMAILQIHCYFLLKKCENPLHCKGFSCFQQKITVYNYTVIFCKGFSHFFSTKSNSVFAFEVKLTKF